MKSFALIIIGLILTGSALALDVKLTPIKDSVDVMHNGKKVRVQRIQNQEHTLTGSFAKTSRRCPPFCIHPMKIAPGVQTVGEVEIFTFMENQLANGSGLIIDARLPAWYKKGTIPGSINISFTVFEKPDDDAQLINAFQQLGVRKHSDESRLMKKLFSDSNKQKSKWDFSHAKELILWCNGPWCDQSPRAIRGLLKHGYPAEKLHYYRGGMQMWQILGLLTVQ